MSAVLYLESGQLRAAYRVVWIGEKGCASEGHVGLECVDSEGVFGIAAKTGDFLDEYKRVEAELHRTQDRYKSLFENSLGLICTHDLDGTVLAVNPAAANALGYERDQAKGQNLAAFLAPSVRSQFPEYLKRVRRFGHDSGSMLIVARNRTKHVWLYRNLLISESGDAPYVVGHAMDITNQKRAEYRLQSTLSRLQKALAEVKTLAGLLPICAWCKKIRAESGEWIDLESYVALHSEAHFSHGVCPTCLPNFRAGKGQSY